MPTAQSALRQAGASKVIILGAILIGMLVVSGTVLALYFGGVFGGGAGTAAGDTGDAVEVAEAPAPRKPPLYVPLDPPMVINFERNGRMGFLQLTMQVMTRDSKVGEGIARHMPVIRNNLLMLVSSKTYDEISTVDGKLLLRQEALAAVNAVLEAQRVEGRAEDLYFTGFVMQ